VNVRQEVYRAVAPEARDSAGLSLFNLFVVVTIVAAITIAILETEPTIRVGNETSFRFANLFFGSFFTFEYLLRVWSAGVNPSYRGARGLIRYVFSVSALIDFVVLIPFWLSFGIGNTAILRLVRLLRLVSLAKMGRFSTALSNIGKALASRAAELGISVAMAVAVILIAATVLYTTEGAANPNDFGSVPRALWWGVATVTKVGYGGAFPVTVLGKIAAAILAFGAVGVIAVPTGILAGSFSIAFRSSDEEQE